jgi:hypothetical protein
VRNTPATLRPLRLSFPVLRLAHERGKPKENPRPVTRDQKTGAHTRNIRPIKERAWMIIQRWSMLWGDLSE